MRNLRRSGGPVNISFHSIITLQNTALKKFYSLIFVSINQLLLRNLYHKYNQTLKYMLAFLPTYCMRYKPYYVYTNIK